MKHSRCCKNFPQTPIIPCDPSKVEDEGFVLHIQKSIIVSAGGDDLDDSDTVPPNKNDDDPKYRYLSRKEAIREILTDPLIMHRDEVWKRDEFIDRIIKEIVKYKGPYFTGVESSFVYFFRYRTKKWDPLKCLCHPDAEMCECYVTSLDDMDQLEGCECGIKPEWLIEEDWRKFTKSLRKYWGVRVCPACLHEAQYIWREADMIQRYLECRDQ